MFGVVVVSVLVSCETLLSVYGDEVTLPVTSARPIPTTFVPRSTLPDVIYHYKDIYGKPYTPGVYGRPLLAYAKSTCWARGGLCMPLRRCQKTMAGRHHLVPDCDARRMVCCLVNKEVSPSVGPLRSSLVAVQEDLEVDEDLMSLASLNSDLLGSVG